MPYTHTHTKLSLQITLIGLMGSLIKGHIFYHYTMSNTTDLILMKVEGLIRAVFWHLTFFILIDSMGTLQYNKRPHFQDLKGHNCHSSRSDLMKCCRMMQLVLNGPGDICNIHEVQHIYLY